VTMIANPGSDAAAARAACTGEVEVLELPIDDSWLRDTGPIFLNRDRAAGFRFNGWGGKYILDGDEAVAGQIGDDILAYLRTVSLRQLEGPIGLENIRHDLGERAAIRSDGKVRAFVIRTLVVQ